MADNVTADAGSGGAVFAADDIASVFYPRTKITLGADGVTDGDVSSANPLPVTGTVAVTNAGLTELAAAINGSSQMDVNLAASNATVTVSNAGLTELAAAINVSSQVDVNIAASGATVPVSLTSTTITGTVAVTDNAGSLTVDGTVTANLAAGTNNIGDVDVLTVPAPLNIVGGGLEATALRVTIASDSTGVVSVDDGGGSLTVDGTVGVSGTVAVTQSGTWDEVGINDSGNSITVDAPVGTPAFVRLSDGAAAITTLPVSLASVPSHAVTNAGTFVTQENGGALTALQLLDNTIFVDDAAFTPGTSSVSMVGYQADETSTDSVNEGDAGAARMTLDRKQIHNPQPHTAGGCAIFKTLDLDETEEEVKATAGQIYGWSITNFATAVRHIKFYNATAANTTVGTTTPVMTISVPGNATDDTQSVFNLGGMGIPFDTALSVAATTGLADNDTGAPGASDVSLMLFYK